MKVILYQCHAFKHHFKDQIFLNCAFNYKIDCLYCMKLRVILGTEVFFLLCVVLSLNIKDFKFEFDSFHGCFVIET